MELIRSGSAVDLRTIESAAALLRRLHPEDGEEKLARDFTGADLSPAGRISLAGLMLALSAGDPATEEAADFLLARLRQGGPEGMAAARMISFFDGTLLLDRLEVFQDAAAALAPEILEALDNAVLRCAGKSSILAGRLRLAIRRFKNPERWSRLAALLGVLERLSGGDYLRVAVDF
jgi:hypothetical protein